MTPKELAWEAFSAGMETSTGCEVDDDVRADFESWWDSAGREIFS